MSILLSSILLVCAIGGWTREFWEPRLKKSRVVRYIMSCVRTRGYPGCYVFPDEFSHDDVDDDDMCLYIGSRKTGKTISIASTLLAKRNSFKTGIVFTANKASIPTYESVTPPSTAIHVGFHHEILREFLLRRANGAAMDDHEPMFIVIDDCLPPLVSPCIQELFTNHGNLKIFLLVAIQYPRAMSPILRYQSDHVFISSAKMTENERGVIHQDFCCGDMSLADFELDLAKTTAGCGSLVLTMRPWSLSHWRTFVSLPVPTHEQEDAW